jgi:hypothetical protein
VQIAAGYATAAQRVACQKTNAKQWITRQALRMRIQIETTTRTGVYRPPSVSSMVVRGAVRVAQGAVGGSLLGVPAAAGADAVCASSTARRATASAPSSWMTSSCPLRSAAAASSSSDL